MKTLYIITGLPGTGKTLLACKLQPISENRIDDMFKMPELGRIVINDVMVITTTKTELIDDIVEAMKGFRDINIQHITCNTYLSKSYDK